MYIVLITEGKNESVDNVTVKLFEEKTKAEEFCKVTTDDETLNKKYWTLAEIIDDGKRYEISRYSND